MPVVSPGGRMGPWWDGLYSIVVLQCESMDCIAGMAFTFFLRYLSFYA